MIWCAIVAAVKCGRKSGHALLVSPFRAGDFVRDIYRFTGLKATRDGEDVMYATSWRFFRHGVLSLLELS